MSKLEKFKTRRVRTLSLWMFALAMISTVAASVRLYTDYYDFTSGEGIWGAGVCWIVAALGIAASFKPTRSVVLSYFAMSTMSILVTSAGFSLAVISSLMSDGSITCIIYTITLFGLVLSSFCAASFAGCDISNELESENSEPENRPNKIVALVNRQNIGIKIILNGVTRNFSSSDTRGCPELSELVSDDGRKFQLMLSSEMFAPQTSTDYPPAYPTVTPSAPEKVPYKINIH